MIVTNDETDVTCEQSRIKNEQLTIAHIQVC
jgi:hypothetical protein